jgi:hypothetical protein
VHSDLAASRVVYDGSATCAARSEADVAPFEKYANAALGLSKPSPAARALAAAARDIERVERLVQPVAPQKGRASPPWTRSVAPVDAWLARNRARDRKAPDATSAAPTL